MHKGIQLQEKQVNFKTLPWKEREGHVPDRHSCGIL